MTIHTNVAIIITRHLLLNTLIKHYEFTILVQFYVSLLFFLGGPVQMMNSQHNNS